ncbi:MAG TPA: hypothetical protein VMY05_01140 [Acidobacteriota bacterium]|nr:hypothetical protein [Acidobacteriota bacterium]
MTSSSKCFQLGMTAVLLIFLAAQPSDGKIISSRYSPQNGQDLFLLGFGELTMQVLDVSGNKEAFESSNPNLSTDFSTNYRLSLLANGNATRDFLVNGAVIVDSRIGDEYQTVDPSIFRLKMSVESREPLWDGWRFTGRGVYDPNRQWELENLDTRLLTQPQEPSRLELLMRLENDEYGVVEGGSLRPSFKGAQFTLHQRSVFGVYTDLHTGRVGLEAVGGKLEGKSYREGGAIGIRANGTSGPFDLSRAPITRGSEEVKIQVRDRFDETTVLSSRTLVRDIDYNVDYLRGRVLLHQPVASETASADPVYVVITFDYLRSDNDDIMGGRARVAPNDDVQVSGSYLHRNLDDGAIGPGIEEPEDLLAADGSFKVEDHTTGYFEVAGTENPGVDDQFMALRVGARTEVIDDLTLRADFRKIEDQFRSFTNADLDPNKNQRWLQIGGDYQLTERQRATAGFADTRGLKANGQFNPYDGLRDEKVYTLGYRNDLRTELGFGLRLERRDNEDVANAVHEDNYQNRAIVDLGGRLEDVSVLGQFGYKAAYELILFRNELQIGDHDANTNQLALTLTSKPSERANIAVTQRFSLRKDRALDLYDERQDVSFLTVQFRPHDNVNTLTTYEYKRYTVPRNNVTFWQDDGLKQLEWAETFALEYLPLKKVKALGKVGRYELQRAGDYRVTNDFLLGQVTYFHTHHLSFNGESEYRRTARHYPEYSRDKTWDLGLRVNWNKDRFNEFTAGLIRRWQLHSYPPGAQVTASSYIVLVSGAASIVNGFFARASIKGILLNDPLNDEKTFAKLEVGYDSHHWYRASVGYERIQSDIDLHPDRDYTGQGVFVRFTGKM